jgi:hypothetical protein
VDGPPDPPRPVAVSELPPERRPILPVRRDARPQAIRLREKMNAVASAVTDERSEPSLVAPPAPVETTLAPIATVAPPSPVIEAPPAARPKDKELSEAEILLLARRALGSNPAAALGWVREHERRFASPALAQEREIIAIDALRRLKRVREASARSERFFAAYPSSIHGRSIESPSAPPVQR